MTIIQLKILSIITIFSIGFIGGWTALKLGSKGREKTFFSLGSALAAGVFLGASLLHMLPDAQELFALSLPNSKLPLAEIYMGIGFALILFLDRVAFSNAHGNTMINHQNSNNIVRPYALLTILSLHSVIAGITLGAEKSILGSGAILIAILSHKASAGFSLGIDFRRSQLPLTTSKRALLLFAAMTPLGIIFGTALSQLLGDNGSNLSEAIFDGIAAGTFLYIGTVELITDEFSKKELIWSKFALLITGFSIMAIIALWL